MKLKKKRKRGKIKMTKEELIKEIESHIDFLLDELGDSNDREAAMEPALIRIIVGYFNDVYTKEDVVEGAKYLGFSIDIDKIEQEKIKKQKEKMKRAEYKKRAKTRTKEQKRTYQRESKTFRTVYNPKKSTIRSKKPV